MSVAKGILTARGGMPSHAAVVARGMGKCCISGAGAVHVDYKTRTIVICERTYREGDWLSLNGSTGEVYEGQLPTQDPQLSGDFGRLMQLADRYKRLQIRTNADTPEEAKIARNFGAKGIGLCRTEHMFFEGERINAVREMSRLPVVIRLLDPPLHEFLPRDEAGKRVMANEMQARAIFQAAFNTKAAGFEVKVEIMVPLIGSVRELTAQAEVIQRTAAKVFAERN